MVTYSSIVGVSNWRIQKTNLNNSGGCEMGLIIATAVLVTGYTIVSNKGARWYWAAFAGLIPAALCAFFGIFGLVIAALVLASYWRMELP